jgi:GAF domain-containing protein
MDCFRTSRPIAAPDLRGMTEWPRFIAHTLETGYRSVHAVPMRLRTETIGALNLFGIQPRALGPDELRIAQALADVVTIGILQERAIRRREVLAEQLQVALNSRVVIEQAKGVLAERGQLEMERSFEVLRGHARATNQRLSDVALGVANRTIAADVVLGRPRQHVAIAARPSPPRVNRLRTREEAVEDPAARGAGPRRGGFRCPNPWSRTVVAVVPAS